MEITLDSIKMLNFKKISDKEITFSGRNATITAPNGTGKTTVYDAFTWLLFDKDAAGRANFVVKPTDENGEAIHLLETIVEGFLHIDGEPLQLKKLLKEMWVKKHGDTEKTFSGHETKYWVNEVPVSAGEFSKRVAEIIEEKTFRRITSSEYFVNLSIPEMRRILTDMAGDISDEEVAGDDENLISLIATLKAKKYKQDDLLKVTRQNILLYKKEVAEIPARISEARLQIPEAQEWGGIEEEQAALLLKIQEIDNELFADDKAADALRLKGQQIAAKHTAADELKRKLANDSNIAEDQAEADLRRAKLRIEAITDDSKRASINANTLSTQITEMKKELEDSRAEYIKEQEVYKAIFAEAFAEVEAGDTACPYCSQRLPEEQVSQIREAARTAFTQQKEKRLQESKDKAQTIVNKGFEIKKKIEAAEAKVTAENAKIKAAMEEYTTEKAAFDVLAARPINKKLPAEFDANPDVMAILEEAATMKAEMDQTQREDRTALIQRKKETQELAQICAKKLMQKTYAEAAEARVIELTERNRTLGDLIAEQEGIKDALEKFNRKKSEMLENAINGRFHYVTFRLFKTNINGGTEDCCEPLINGIPYTTNGSHGEKIKARLDIVRTMQDASGITAPVFADDMEGLTMPFEMDSQTIKLIAREGPEELIVKLED